MKYASRPFFFGSYLAAILLGLPFTIGPLIGGEGAIEPEHAPFVFIGSIFSIYAFIVFVILLYRMWKSCGISIHSRLQPLLVLSRDLGMDGGF